MERKQIESINGFADFEAIEKLLMFTSAYEIEQAAGISRQMLGKYKNGQSKLNNMSLEVAMKLTDYYYEVKNRSNKENELAAIEEKLIEIEEITGLAKIELFLNMEHTFIFYNHPGLTGGKDLSAREVHELYQMISAYHLAVKRGEKNG